MKKIGAFVLLVILKAVIDTIAIYIYSAFHESAMFMIVLNIVVVGFSMLIAPFILEIPILKQAKESKLMRWILVIACIFVLVYDFCFINVKLDITDSIVLYLYDYNLKYIRFLQVTMAITMVINTVIYALWINNIFDSENSWGLDNKRDDDNRKIYVPTETYVFYTSLKDNFEEYLRENKYHTRLAFQEFNYTKTMMFVFASGALLFFFWLFQGIWNGTGSIFGKIFLTVGELFLPLLLLFLIVNYAFIKKNSKALSDLILRYGVEKKIFDKFDESLMIFLESIAIEFPINYRLRKLEKSCILCKQKYNEIVPKW